MPDQDTIVIAHLSDVHLAPLPRFMPWHWNVKRTLGWLNWQLKRRTVHTRAALDLIVADVKAQAPDHILVSGDLINIGLPAEFVAARDWLASLGSPDRVSIVWGNHDNYLRSRAVTYGLPLWRDYMVNDAYGRSIDPLGPTATVFPFVRKIGTVALIGVCSAVPTPIGYATGRVAGQLDRLAILLRKTKADGLLRLVMIHHPPVPGLSPDRRALTNAADLEAVLRAEGAELVVFGHNHRNIRQALGATQLVGVASASAARAYHGEPAACYNLIRASRTGFTVETRGLVDGALAVGPVVL